MSWVQYSSQHMVKGADFSSFAAFNILWLKKETYSWVDRFFLACQYKHTGRAIAVPLVSELASAMPKC